MTWIAREDAQQMLWQAIANAQIEDGDAATLAWQHGLAELSPQERSERVGEIVASNPAILEGLRRLLEGAFDGPPSRMPCGPRDSGRTGSSRPSASVGLHPAPDARLHRFNVKL